MSPSSIQDRIEILKGIDLAVPQGHGVVYSNDQDSAYVAAGSCLAFRVFGSLPAKMKDDVLNTTLLAQLAANKQHDRQNEPTAWYDYYKYVLKSAGWVFGDFNLVHLSDANSYLTVDNLLLKLATEDFSGEELALYTKMIEALKQAKNESARKLFDLSSKSSNKANFQAGVASNPIQGMTIMTLGTYYYSAEKNIDTVLFFNFGSQKIDFYGGSMRMVLDDDMYSQLRETVLDKLGAYANGLIIEIEL
ncbi:hypothetical protein C8T65DRAFT_651203 [Cerioporus squamosus]|nr:hypothetical protein C8T65DRAFT_651203 [Cerioporus squamosus]